MAESAPTIRPATPGDSAALAALGARVFAATYGMAIPRPMLRAYLDEYFSPQAFALLATGPMPLFVATVDAHLAGYARLATPDPPAGVEPGAVELGQLYVDQEYQGRGVGVALLAAACAATPAPLWLCAWERNERALRFYERHGFATVGRMDVRVYSVVFHDLVLVRPARPALEATL